ncbi:MAG: transketolase [Spirochaetia bacterium]|nr:transketolase [Spirochaetia bacterium]
MDTKQLANAVRILSMDGVQKANSGHPGAPMGMADIAEVLWRKNLKHNPGNPKWVDRDRFVLSNGHASMLLYSLLHLTGYDLPVSELKKFRQLNSKTAGHPEYKVTPGIETTTGPLGQGIANAVGMALAEKILAAHFNREGFPIVDHYSYAFTGDGCLMEGISHEACSLAGTLGLGKLIVFYDNNGISIDGEVKGWFTDDTEARFRAYGWQVISVEDGHNAEAIQKALNEAKSESGKPAFISCSTKIGFGSPNKEGSESCHGAPLGAEEIILTRKALGWKYDEPFFIPEEIYNAWDGKAAGSRQENLWNTLFTEYSAAYPELAAEFTSRMNSDLPTDWDEKISAYITSLQGKGETIATRKASQNVLQELGPMLPSLLGGSADLAPSNLTMWKGSKAVTSSDADGNYIHYGVREFGMAAIMNGLTLHGGFVPYGGTFLIFMEYARNAIRMASLMGIQVIYVFTHDSIGLGEDGPTHQPVEQISSLRGTPGMTTWRPADTVETAAAWKSAIMKKDGPTSLILSRQNLPVLPRDAEQISHIEKGAYILWENSNSPEYLIIATGSEVELALGAAKKYGDTGKKVRVVSMPSPEQFEKQTSTYKELVLPTAVTKRLAVEAAHKDFWYKYTGLNGNIIGMTTFGESAPAAELFKLYGFTEAKVLEALDSL